MTRADRAAEIQNAIRRVLFEKWDPIGVNHNSKLSDEYDSYIAPVYRVLSGSRSKDELVACLDALEEQLGTHRHAQEELALVAQELLDLNVRLDVYAP